MKNFKLRMSLFRIWFVKNIVLFLEIIGITLFILVFTGVLPETTPIFGPLIMEIRSAEGDSSTWVHVLSIITTCLTSVAVFLTRVKSIALSDIKSDKLKLSLVHANMYFNEQGKLVKKQTLATATAGTTTNSTSTEASNTDADEEAGISNIKVATNLFTGIKNAVSEFFAIATVKLDDDEEKAQAQAETIIKDNDMEEAAAKVQEIDEQRAETFNKKVDEVVDETVDEAVKDTENDDKACTAEKKDRIVLIKKLGEWIKKMLHKEKKSEEEETAIKAEKAAKKEAKKQEKLAKKAAKAEKKKAEETTKTEAKTETKETKKEVVEKKEETKAETKTATTTKAKVPSDPISDFLKSIK